MKLSTLSMVVMLGLGVIPSANAESKGKILILVSGKTAMTLTDGSTMKTGYYLNEFGVPADALIKAGYELQVVTPKGNAPSVDPHSVTTKYFGNSEAELKRIQTMIASLPGIHGAYSVNDALHGNLDQYAGLFIPGGHAPLIDLANDPDVGKLLTYFHAHHKPTAALCHGPITLLSAQAAPQQYESELIHGQKPSAKNWAYKGYRMTIFSTPEEQGFEGSLNGAKLRYYPAYAMESAGAKTEFAPMWHSHVVVDRELVTGQNPFSDKELASAYIALLDKQPK
jgi:putative intracellular protease/amidase